MATKKEKKNAQTRFFKTDVIPRWKKSDKKKKRKEKKKAYDIDTIDNEAIEN